MISGSIFGLDKHSNIEVRRSRLTCAGSYHCEEVDMDLMDIDRYELDTTSRDTLFAAQMATREREGTTAAKRVAT